MAEYVIDLTGVEVKTIKEAHSIEAIEALWGLPVREEVVRCRDCDNATECEDGTLDCHGPLVQTWDYWNDEPLRNPVPPDGFCAWGKRRAE